MKFLRTVCLNDEHNQPIDIHEDKDGFWWSWTLLDDDEKYGPYKSAAEAYQDAEDYANAGAPCEGDF